MFFKNQPKKNQTEYLELLEIVGSLSNLFSENPTPYLHYRATENLFCMCLEAKNLSRSDCTADASKDTLGLGIKTFIETNSGSSMQKIAEFNRRRGEIAHLDHKELIKKVCKFRNERIEFTKRTHDLENIIYHYTARRVGKISILECSLDLIDTASLKIEKEKENVIYFNDGLNEYSFNLSKSTLYKRFYTTDVLDEVSVSIIKNPYEVLQDLFAKGKGKFNFSLPVQRKRVYLPLFSDRGTRHVPERSGLNQWNALGRKRHPNEVYIRVPSFIHRDYKGFFPSNRIETFKLELPNGKILSAKMCQDGAKGLMSNPNKELGHWLLRHVFQVPEGELLTMETLERVGVDSVVVYKEYDGHYTIDFANTGSFDSFKNNTDLGMGVDE